MKAIRITCVVFAALLLVGAAVAQGFGGGQGRQGRGGFGNDYGTLLRRADVVQELKLTDDQKTKIQDASQKIQQERRDMMQNAGGDFQAMQEVMRKKQPEWDKAILSILTDTQQTRAKELMIQRLGNQAIMREDIQKALGFTDDQKAKLKALQDKQREAQASLREKMQNQELTREEAQEAMQKNQKTMSEELGKILTDSQKDQLKKMGGTPFKFEENTGGGGGL